MIKTPRRIFEEVKIDILPVVRWFGEDTFTYIIVLGSIVVPHVLPYYAPYKLLEREIAYLTVGDGLTKTLMEMKKLIWPTFPLQCGTFTLHDYGHPIKEIDNITSLKLCEYLR